MTKAEKPQDGDVWDIVTALVQEAHSLLRDVIEATTLSDERARQHGADWTTRHRLHVLLEAAEQTAKGRLNNVVVAPWFLAEFMATIDIVRRWKGRPGWSEIEPALKSPQHFGHTTLKLQVAEHLERDGHRVALVPRGVTKSPDLSFWSPYGTKVLVECYQPTALCGRPSGVSSSEVKKIVQRVMAKAKNQIGGSVPGILAVCGYNQLRYNLDRLSE